MAIVSTRGLRSGLGSTSFLVCLGSMFSLAGCSQNSEQAPLGISEQAATGAFSISGIVSTSKGPVGGATVKLQGSESRTAFTDAAGKYTIPGLGNGAYQLSASSSSTCASSTVNLNTLTASVTVDLGMTGAGCASLVYVPGPTGPTGPAGAKGATGDEGATGATGAAGAVGPVGATGATGAQGLQGVPGLPGAPGAPGVPGAPGAQGPAGPAGAPGPAGSAGPKGDTGATGPQGPVGPAAGEDPDLVQVGVITLGEFDTKPILAFSQSIEQVGTTSAGGSGAGRAIFSPISIVRYQDELSPNLHLLSAKGQHIEEADFAIGPNFDIKTSRSKRCSSTAS
jgi:hypothetical protein